MGTATVRRKTATTRKHASKGSSKSSTSEGIDHGQRRKVIVEQLLTDIVQGRLQPGERLVITSLAARFGVSQSPIREALVTLEGIGLIDIEPNCGAVVRQVTRSDIQEICEVREALECTAVRLACGAMDPVALRQLADAFHDLAQQDITRGSGNEKGKGMSKAAMQRAVDSARELDSQLHDLIAESCGNRYLRKELGRLKLLFRSFRDIAWRERSSASDLARCAEEAREHLAIVEALLRGDAKGAASAMSRHIHSGVKYWGRGLHA